MKSIPAIVLLVALGAWSAVLAAALAPPPQRTEAYEPSPVLRAGSPIFQTAADCMACHNGLMTSRGEDVSFGSAWRATMMANSSRDPYWHASVRRETIDHPKAADHIEDECSVCHMPMSRTMAGSAGRLGRVFAHLPVGQHATDEALLAADGVSCTVCHQITPERFGDRGSFTGGFVVNTDQAPGERPLFGPFPIQTGHTRIMHSATGFRPAESAHIRLSEMCATCHTLYTKARGPDGEEIGELPEQVPYLEWQHSAFRTERSCQSCHMPVIDEPIRISSVLGELRTGAARHNFIGANFFMLRMLNRYRDELGVEALPQELDAAVRATVQHLQSESARLSVSADAIAGGRLPIGVVVENLAGHKLPTAYPSRRAWLHVAVRDGGGLIVFESGAIAPDGSIRGNDQDADAARVEPHHVEVTRGDQVQIYESVMADPKGAPTTGLLTAVRFIKDNRLLPRGFDKAAAPADIAVHGAAASDSDFTAGGDRTRYLVDVSRARGPFSVEVALRYQPIAFRWAQNLKGYDAAEPRRFVRYYDSMAAASSEVVARATAVVR